MRFDLRFPLLGLLAFAYAGCKSGEGAEDTKSEKASPAQVPSAAASGAPFRIKGKNEMGGPLLVVQPGRGLSSIWFGATKATVQKHMGAPCQVDVPGRCVYPDRAVDFYFEKDALVKVRVERRDRPALGLPGAPRYFGLFNGVLAPDIRLGLHRHVTEQEMQKKPTSKAPLSGADGQLERWVFPGITFEFDKLENGNVVLSAFELVKDPEAKAFWGF